MRRVPPDVLNCRSRRRWTEATSAQLELIKAQRNAQENLLATLTGTPAPDFRIPPGRLPASLPLSPSACPRRCSSADPMSPRPNARPRPTRRSGLPRLVFFPSLLVAPMYLAATTRRDVDPVCSALDYLVYQLTAAQTIFDGGRISANLRFAKAGYAGTLANYRQSVLVAMQETQDAMNTLTQLDAVRRRQDEAVKNYDKAYSISLIRYREGLIMRRRWR